MFVSVDSLMGQVSVPFDLVKKQPKGQQTFALMTKDVVTGTLTTEVKPQHHFSINIIRLVSLGIGYFLKLSQVILSLVFILCG